MDQPGKGCQSMLLVVRWTGKHKPLSPFAPENFDWRDNRARLSRPASVCLLSTLKLNLVLVAVIPTAFGNCFHLFIRLSSGQSLVSSRHPIED